jgi:uncharacterized protein YmfQ (DUF2313 family)
MHSADEYTGQLQALLPQGRAWPRTSDSWLGRLLAGLAEEFARIDARAYVLLDESIPLTALELLPDWERVAGLPDACIPISDVVRERQLAVARKIAGIGGQSRAFFIELAARVGLAAEIDEFHPFTCISYCEDELFNDDWRHVFRVRIVGATEGADAFVENVSYFTAISRCNERLVAWGNDNLECLINRAKPAHTIALFAYDLEPDPALWFDFTIN